MSGPTTNRAGFACSPSMQAQITMLVGEAGVAARICSTIEVAGLTANDAATRWMLQELIKTQQAVEETKTGLDAEFLLFSAYKVFVMQVGFALYAAGVIRGKNLVTILMKSFSDACFSAIVMYLIGYAIAFGEGSSANGFIGTTDFALGVTSHKHPERYPLWVWNWAFAAAATTILSGSIAERATYVSYVLYCLWITAWVYPLVAHWVWSDDGWMSAFNDKPILGSGVVDFSGSSVVHVLGATASLVACIVLGPRMGKFDAKVPDRSFKATSPPLYLLGTFLLWFGWYGFNTGSAKRISTYTAALITGRVAVNTTLAPAAGAISTMLLVFYHKRTWDLLATCTGAISGLVAIGAGCSVLEPWAAIIAGLACGPACIYSELLLAKLKIDDAISAVPVHGTCGIWGMLLVALLAKREYMAEVYESRHPDQVVQGLFYGGHGELLACQVLALVVIIAWTAAMMWLLFYAMSKAGILRVKAADEAVGLDQAVMGGATAQQAAVDPRVSACKVVTSPDSVSRLPLYAPGVSLKGFCIQEDPQLEPSINEENIDRQASLGAANNSQPSSALSSQPNSMPSSRVPSRCNSFSGHSYSSAFLGIIGAMMPGNLSPTKHCCIKVPMDRLQDHLPRKPAVRLMLLGSGADRSSAGSCNGQPSRPDHPTANMQTSVDGNLPASSMRQSNLWVEIPRVYDSDAEQLQ